MHTGYILRPIAPVRSAQQLPYGRAHPERPQVLDRGYADFGEFLF